MKLELENSAAAFESALADAGLAGLDAIGRRRVRQLITKQRQVKPFTGCHAVTLNGLDALDELAALDDLDGIGRSLKKAVKKVGKTVKKVAKEVERGVAKASLIAPPLALALPTKKTLAAAKTGTLIAGSAAAALAAGNPKGAVDAVQNTVAVLNPTSAESMPVAMPIYDDGGAQPGQVLTGQYLAAGEPDPVPTDPGQWIPGVENKWVLLGAATGLSGLLVLVVRNRRRRERGYAA